MRGSQFVYVWCAVSSVYLETQVKIYKGARRERLIVGAHVGDRTRAKSVSWPDTRRGCETGSRSTLYTHTWKAQNHSTMHTRGRGRECIRIDAARRIYLVAGGAADAASAGSISRECPRRRPRDTHTCAPVKRRKNL